ncbi:MAG: hypothetical protein M1458_01405 [Deltaproteobacteria bacterium]|nr:hypothetical protein [Deltaproteobacteria bacterium]
MKKKQVLTLIALFILAVSFAMSPKKASAIPSFAQKYHFSCAVCHTVFPNLNPFGREFWRNGFRLPGTNGTPSDATQITEGLSLPNPWPIPIMIEPIIGYQHYTNENVPAVNGTPADAFSAGADVVAGGAFKLYTPLANSLSFYVHYGATPLKAKQIFASINGLGNGFGVPSHLLNLKLGQVTTASPYFYRQMPFYILGGPLGNGQGLTVGYDAESAALIHSRNAGFAIYGTPGYHLWYKITLTNDNGSYIGSNPNGASNAMEYSYQLKEYAQIPMGQLEFGYYGATIAQPVTSAGYSWSDRVAVNGVDVDIANDIYELGLTYMVQGDNHPYGNPSQPPANFYNAGGTVIGDTHSSNGYSTFEVYGRYLFPQIGNGLMLSADYAQYSWTHKDLQEAYNGAGQTPAACSDAGLYESGSYVSSNGCISEGIKDAFAIEAEYNLAYNAHLYLAYLLTNKAQDNTLGTGLDFAF